MNHRNQRDIIWSNSRQSFLERQILRNINEEHGDFHILFYIARKKKPNIRTNCTLGRLGRTSPRKFRPFYAGLVWDTRTKCLVRPFGAKTSPLKPKLRPLESKSGFPREEIFNNSQAARSKNTSMGSLSFNEKIV